MPFLERPGKRSIYYTEEGQGRPVLYLHGWGCDGADWSWMVSDMPDYRNVVVDHRGHGRSTAGRGPFSTSEFAADVAAVADSLEIRDAVVIGHSMGGAIACALAVNRPDVVSSLILVDPAHGAEDDDISLFLEGVGNDPLAAARMVLELSYGPSTPTWLPVWHRRRLNGMDPTVILESAVGYTTGDDGYARRVVAERQFPLRNVPTLAIYSSVSAKTASWDRTLHHGTADEIEVWPEHGHFLHQEAPDRFSSRVREWLDHVALPN